MELALNKLRQSKSLSDQEAFDCFVSLFEAEVSDAAISELLTLLQQKGASAEEIQGFLRYLGSVSTGCTLPCDTLFDVCGTGGDGKNTINISTLTAFVLAAMGEKVAKHGNYSASSAIGSSNLLEALGVPLVANEENAQRIFSKCGIVFLHAPYWHPKLKRVGAIRKALGFRTVFNLLGPLLNPTKPKYQIVGTPNAALAEILANVVVPRSRGGDQSYAIINDHNGYDEVSLTGNVNVHYAEGVKELSPSSFGSQVLSPSDLSLPETLAQTQKLSEAFLAGEAASAHGAVVAANTALALSLRYPDKKLSDHFAEAQQTIDSGKAFQILELLRSQQ